MSWMQVRKTGWSQSAAASNIHSYPWEQGCGMISEAHKDGVSAKKNTNVGVLCKVWWIRYHAEIKTKGGEERKNVTWSHTYILSPLHYSKPPSMLQSFHPHNSLFICPSNACLNVSLSGKKQKCPVFIQSIEISKLSAFSAGTFCSVFAHHQTHSRNFLHYRTKQQGWKRRAGRPVEISNFKLLLNSGFSHLKR